MEILPRMVSSSCPGRGDLCRQRFKIFLTHFHTSRKSITQFSAGRMAFKFEIDPSAFRERSPMVLKAKVADFGDESSDLNATQKVRLDSRDFEYLGVHPNPAPEIAQDAISHFATCAFRRRREGQDIAPAPVHHFVRQPLV